MMYQESGITKRELRKLMNEEYERVKAGIKSPKLETVEDFEEKYVMKSAMAYKYKAVIIWPETYGRTGASIPKTNSLEMITETVAKAIVKGYHGRMYIRTETGYRTVKEF